MPSDENRSIMRIGRKVASPLGLRSLEPPDVTIDSIWWLPAHVEGYYLTGACSQVLRYPVVHLGTADFSSNIVAGGISCA